MRLRPFTVSFLFQFSLLIAQAGQPGMVFVPGGEFLRGRSHESPDDGLKWCPTLLKDDRPVRGIFVDHFYLDRHEVTNQDFAAFVEATGRAAPYYWPKGQLPRSKHDYPVVNVDWGDASAYCRWAGKRLPTEAEWERACRGLAEGAVYPWGDRDPTKEDVHFDVITGPGQVCRFPESYFGLCDMAGNVWEWCADWYEKDYYQRAPQTNPQGPESGLYRVLRGGSWADLPKFLTCAYRSFARPAERSPNVGFRCAKSFR